MPAPRGHPPYNKNGEGGRSAIYTKAVIDRLAEELEIWLEDKENLFIQKFAYQVGFNHRKVSEFKELSERFREACDKLDAKQQFSLFEGGLKKKYAYPMCALILSHSHGIHQKTEQKVTGDVANPLAFIVQEVDGSTKDLVNE